MGIVNQDTIFKNRYAVGAMLIAVLVGIFVVVYYAAKPKGGFVPRMPPVEVDADQISFAVARLNKRASSVSLESYHTHLRSAFHALNQAEARGKDAKLIDSLRKQFVTATEISQTAKKERYILMGDYLAVEFERALNRFLALIQQRGLEGAMKHQNGTAYQTLVSLSGNFLKESIRLGLISPLGKLTVAPYVPQILFRKRWRMLGEIPFRYRFLEIESLVDASYILMYGNPMDTSTRLKAMRRIHRRQPDFDTVIATALIYYEGKETSRAKQVLANAQKQHPDNFVINEFLLFLTNATK